jgi:hypothetical protein
MINKEKLTSSSFFSKKTPRVNSASSAVSGAPPAGYIPVRLTGSRGRLSAPAMLHFRNYTFAEAIELAEMRPENADATFSRILTQMCWEKFPCEMLHREEAKEILLNVYATWWGKTLDVFYYAVDENKALSPENRSVASIPLTAIKIDELPVEFSEPIMIEDSIAHQRVGFVLPRLINDIAAQEYINAKYAETDASFSDVRVAIRMSDRDGTPLNVGSDRLEAYEDNERRKRSEEIEVLCALQLFSVDGRVLLDLDEKLDALQHRLPANFFSVYSAERKKSLRFGVNELVTFACSITHQPIARRFPFRLANLVPTMDRSGDTGYTVSFGGEVSVDGRDGQADGGQPH